jgi:hypothetical protein
MIRWHRDAANAVKQLGDDWKYPVSLKPGRFHVWSSGEFSFEYKPDVSWLYKDKEGERVAVWEIESGAPDNKRICGDAVLAALLRRNNAFCYLNKSENPKKLGSELRCDEPSEWKSGKLIGRKGEFKVSPEIAAFFLVVEEKYKSRMKENTEPYISALKNKTDLLKGVKVHVCGIPYDFKVEEMKKWLQKDQVIRQWK